MGLPQRVASFTPAEYLRRERAAEYRSEYYAGEIFAMRERGEATVPTTIGAEKAFNPFLRAIDVADFAARRAAKDVFRG